MCIPFTQLKTGLNSLGYPYVKDAEVIRTEREDFKLGSSDKARTELISEIYECLRSIRDPEHPMTLEQLDVVNERDIEIENVDSTKEITIYWKPITQTYALATHVGLSILLKLQMSSYGAYKIKVLVKPGYHKHQAAVDRQINDKERIAAAKENEKLMAFIESLIS